MEKILYAAVIALAWIAKEGVMFMAKKKKNGSASGDMNIDYWKSEFRQALDEKLDQRVLPILEKLTNAHTDIIDLLRDRTAYFQQQTEILKELRDSNRNRRRR